MSSFLTVLTVVWGSLLWNMRHLLPMLISDNPMLVYICSTFFIALLLTILVKCLFALAVELYGFMDK